MDCLIQDATSAAVHSAIAFMILLSQGEAKGQQTAGAEQVVLDRLLVTRSQNTVISVLILARPVTLPFPLVPAELHMHAGDGDSSIDDRGGWKELGAMEHPLQHDGRAGGVRVSVCLAMSRHTHNSTFPSSQPAVHCSPCRHTFKLAQDPNSNILGTTVWDSSIVLAKYLEKVADGPAPMCHGSEHYQTSTAGVIMRCL